MRKKTRKEKFQKNANRQRKNKFRETVGKKDKIRLILAINETND
jgi:hypothetical protein